MAWYRILGFIAIVFLVFQPIHPSASSAVQAATGDGAGPIDIETTTESGVAQAGTGLLVLDAGGEASGVPANGRYLYGDPDAPVSRPAIILTNTAERTHALTIDYDADIPESSRTHVEFLLYDQNGTQAGVVTESSPPVRIEGVSSHASLYVVVIVDTHGLTSADDLSGTVTISV